MAHLGDVLIVGLGRSGQDAARYCAALVAAGEVASVTAVDSADTETLRALAEGLGALGVTVLLGVPEVAGAWDLAIASPGIPPHAPLMRSARAASAHLVSEIEFAFGRSSRPWVAITGTNGKTTTTSLVTHLLTGAGMRARSVGNIGTTAIGAEAVADPDEIFVAEVSSFQLANVDSFRPRVAALLNITPDHLDWHGGLEAYAADKARVFARMTEGDVAVIDVDDPGSAPYAETVAESGAEVVRVSIDGHHPGGATVVDGRLALETRAGLVRLIPASELRIRGSHNVSNALAAAAVAHAMGVSAADLRAGLLSFAPIAHRLEPVGVVDGVEWFNDSKATNPDAVFKALTAFSDAPVVLLLGGRNKGNDFRPLAEEAAGRCKAVVLFGESRLELERAFEGLDVPAIPAVTFDDALEAARSLASAGDAVVLSPACASFDEFRSYEERGDRFRARVVAWAGGQSA